MIDCRLAEHRLHAYVSRELSETEQSEVERHLAACPNCRGRFELEARVGQLRARSTRAKDSDEPKAATGGRPLLRKFTLISLALTLVAAAATTLTMGWIVESYLLGQVAIEARGRLDRVVLPILVPTGLAAPLKLEHVRLLDTAVRQSALSPVIERIALWDLRGNLLYESAPSQTRALPDLLASAANEPRHDVIGPVGGRQLRVLAPIQWRDAVLGIYEVEQGFEPLATHIQEMQFFAAVSLIGFSLALYSLLFRLVNGAARDLKAEASANARLTAAQRRQAERLGVAAELARLLTTSLDLDAIVGATLREVRRLVPFSRATVELSDEDTRTVWTLNGNDLLRRETLPSGVAVARPGVAITVGTAASDSVFHVEIPEHHCLGDSGSNGTRAALTLPLVSKERVLGALNLGDAGVDLYGAEDVEVLRPVAESLAAAIENSQLYAQVQRSNAIASALLETAEALSRLVPLDQLLEEVASRAIELLAADDALIFLMDDAQRVLVLRAAVGVPADRLAAFPLQRVEPEAVAAFARVCQGGGAIAIEDAANSPLLPPGLAEWYGARSCVLVPIEVGGRREGVMVVHFNRGTHHFTEAELRLATGLASQAAVAIANSRAVETVGEVEALREVSRVRSELVSVVSHELRSPISVILGYAELLTFENGLEPGARQMATEILDETIRLNKMVDDLLNLGRIESGRFALACSAVDLGAFAAEAADRFTMTAPNHRIAVVVDSPVEVSADRDRLRQVVDNLVGNAIRYSPDAGTIELRVGRGTGAADGNGYITVRDHGLGIAAADIARLFERFYRSGRAEMREINGTGLGLAVAQSIVAAHGGTIRAESDGPGLGSTFTVELPVVAEPSTLFRPAIVGARGL
ncbi:MAG: GAF domain-containing protein [Chloroflexota bacterium]|nr:MAG: GAF domain-containing protein [Chloroflexota bacterium]